MKTTAVVAQTLCSMLLIASVAQAQDVAGLKQLAQPLGLKIGFEISPSNLSEQVFRNTLIREASASTMTTYWYLPNGDGGLDLNGRGTFSDVYGVHGAYDFRRPILVAEFCSENGIELHGHPLVWADDKYTPPWVLDVDRTHAISLLRNHVWSLVSEFKGDVRVWHVVNEAFDYEGNLVDCYWNRVLGPSSPKSVTPRFVTIAFQAASNADRNAQLIYNDYGQEEVDPRKFNAIIRMMVNMQNRGLPIHGLGWQLHVNASQVLAPDFPLEERMNLVAQLGFDNYVTELDIVMDERNPDGTLPAPKSVYRLRDQSRQAAAYQKITAIVLRAGRCKSMQLWGVSDKQSWLGAARKPLLFDEFFRKKSAYQAVSDALSVVAP